MRLQFIDALGRTVMFPAAPRRVVSLVPSDTYSLCALGLESAIVGRTAYCHDALGAPSVGGTKNAKLEAILDLQPDLVIANQEENTRPLLEALAAHTKVWVSLPRRFDEGVAHVAKLVRIFRAQSAANAELVTRGMASGRTAPAPAVQAFIPIWQDPWMTFCGDTFGSDMLRLAGVSNVFGDRLRLYPLAADLGKSAPADATGRDIRYPRVTLAEVAARQPSCVLLPDEPCTLTAADVEMLRTALPEVPQLSISGKDLFWYGAWAIAALPRLAAKFAPADCA